MRMWMVDPRTMCRRHLLGEHVELHMFVGTLANGVDVSGYIAGNLLEIQSLQQRHEDIAAEMKRRGYNHKSPLREVPKITEGRKIDRYAAENELRRRCSECRNMVNQIEVLQVK